MYTLDQLRRVNKPDGPLQYQGEWNSSANYDVNSKVSFNGVMYGYVTFDFSTVKSPPDNNPHWKSLADNTTIHDELSVLNQDQNDTEEVEETNESDDELLNERLNAVINSGPPPLSQMQEFLRQTSTPEELATEWRSDRVRNIRDVFGTTRYVEPVVPVPTVSHIVAQPPRPPRETVQTDVLQRYNPNREHFRTRMAYVQNKEASLMYNIIKSEIKEEMFEKQNELDVMKLQLELDRAILEEERSLLMNDVDNDKLCIICMDAPITTILMPCNHVKYCSKCAEKLSECSVCRTSIHEYQKIYL
jgi:hypothetical protein